MSDFFDIDFTDQQENVDSIKVEGPSGAIYDVIHEKEKDYWENTVEKYLTEYKFTNISDLQDLDRVVATEMLLYRYQSWLALEKDYQGESVDVESLNKTYDKRSTELRALKKALGIEKVARDKDQGESVAAYIENLRKRAYEFGITRNEMAVKAVTLFQELIAQLTFHDNCTKEERREEGIEPEDILNWVREVKPQFEEIDLKFRQEKQKWWISDQ